MKLTTPPRLEKGGLIYVISPSAGLFPFAPARVERAKKNLEKLGYKVKIAKNASKNSGYVSASINERIEDIHEAFSDKNCQLIMAAIGGNHSNQLIGGIDYGLIKRSPKIFIGYSDNTVLHYAFAAKASLRTYYGPCFLNQFGENPEPLDYTVRYFSQAVEESSSIDVRQSDGYTDELLDWFKNEDAKRPRSISNNTGYEWWRSGKAEGVAVPGALPSINHLLATDCSPNFKNAVLMIDIPEGNNIHEGLSVADFDSWLTDLKNSGAVDRIKGMVISRPYKYSVEQIADIKKVVMRITEGTSIPVLFNLDFGHTDPMITIPIYSRVKLDSSLPGSIKLTP